MVDSTVADLIAVCDNSSVLVTEGTLHEVVIEVTEYSLHMSVLTELCIGITELVVALAERSGGVILRDTELNVVSCIVEAACNVDSAVAVRVEDILVLLHE